MHSLWSGYMDVQVSGIGTVTWQGAKPRLPWQGYMPLRPKDKTSQKRVRRIVGEGPGGTE